MAPQQERSLVSYEDVVGRDDSALDDKKDRSFAGAH